MIALPCAGELCELGRVSASSTSSIERKSLRRSSWATSRIVRSARSTSSRGGASWEWTLLLDLVGRVQQPPQHRVLADDARVLADVADRGDRAREQVDGRRGRRPRSSWPACLRCSTSVSASTGSPAPWSVEHRLEDQAVALAVEVLGLQALVDDQRRQRGVRQQHRAEHGLLGLEVLGRRDRAVERRGAVAVGGAVVGGAHRDRPSLRSGTGGASGGALLLTQSFALRRREVVTKRRAVTTAPGPRGTAATARPPWS